MSVARLRALTHFRSEPKVKQAISRNECGPFEGIDTHTNASRAVLLNKVEMSVARLRALTLFFAYTEQPLHTL